MESPKPKPVKTKKQLNFSEALEQILLGKSVTKKEWGDKKYHVLLAEEHLRLHKPDGKYYDWILTEADMRGDDYVLL